MSHPPDTPRRVGLSLSIDTEEDNWTPARVNITARNLEALETIAGLSNRLGLRTTYFVTYQAAMSPRGAAAVRALVESGNVEIGGHVHPWNTPPFCGLEDSVSMLKNYPVEVQEEKIRSVMKAIEDNIGVRIGSFRVGRFGASGETIGALLRCGVFVDSSVTPLMSWQSYDDGPTFVGAPQHIYRLDAEDDMRVPNPAGRVVEVPLSVGYTRFSPALWPRIAKALERPTARRMHVAGVASRAVFFRRIIISPEVSSVHDMVTTSRRMIDGGMKHLHFFLHSGSLVPGLTPFAPTARDVQRLYDVIEGYVGGLLRFATIEPCTVSEAASWYGPSAEASRHAAVATRPVEVRRPAVVVSSSAASHGATVRGVRPALTTRRLLVISYHYPPDGAVGGLRWAGLSKYLARMGWQVHVVTSAVQDSAEPVPGVVVHTVARRRTMQDQYVGLVSRLRSRGDPAAAGIMNGNGAAPSSIVHRAMTHMRRSAALMLSLPDFARGWTTPAARKARQLLRDIPFSAVVTSGPPHSAHLVGLLATAGRSEPLWVDMRDPWAYDLLVPGAGRENVAWLRGFNARLQTLVVRRSAHVIANTVELAEALRIAHPGAAVSSLQNGIDLELLPRVERVAGRGLSIAYLGTLYVGRDLAPVLAALWLFLEERPEARSSVRLRVAGAMDEEHESRFLQQLTEYGFNDIVDKLGNVSRGDALALLAQSHLAVVLAQDQPLQIPAKLFECIGAEVPTLVIAENESATAREARRIGAHSYEADDIEGICALFERVWRGGVPTDGRSRMAIDYAARARVVDALLRGGAAPTDAAQGDSAATNGAARHPERITVPE